MTVSELATAERAGRTDWLHTIDTLFAEVEGWASALGWSVQKREIEATDDFSHDRYYTPILEIAAPLSDHLLGRDVKLVLEPVTFNPSTETGRIDFYVWPAMYRVRLLHETGHDDWIIKTDSGINWPLCWNQETFQQIAEGFLNA